MVPPSAPRGVIWAKLVFCLMGWLVATVANGQFAVGFTKISSTTGGIPNVISDDAKFGIKSDAIGDLDNDGTPDIAVGATNQGFTLRGSVFIIFLTPQGTAKSMVEIPSPEPSDGDSFGSAVAGIGDLDNDGNEDIAVGAGYDDPDGNQFGAIWIFFLNANGSVKARQKINRQVGNFLGNIAPAGNFGTGMSGLGDLDGDGVEDIAVGADLDDGSVSQSGAVYILFLNANGTVKSHTKISGGMAGFPNILNVQDYFGYGLGKIGDLDNDGVTEIAVGAHRDDDGGTNRGALHILFLNTNGTVKARTKISANGGGFVQPYTGLGYDAAGIGDIDGDGVRDLIVGSNDNNNDGGVVWYLMMNSNGTVKSNHKISNSSGGTNLSLDPGDFFGGSLLSLGDINNDGIKDFGVGAFNDDDGGPDRGAFWISVHACNGISVAGNDVLLCNQSQTTLAANNPGFMGSWTLYQGSGQIQNPGNAITSVTSLGVGTNRFIWDIGATACKRRDTVTVYRVVQAPSDAGKDINTCLNSINLSASTSEPGLWSLVSGSGTIHDPTSPTSLVMDPGPGKNRFAWRVGTTCVDYDTVTVNVSDAPKAVVVSDIVNTCTDKPTVSAVKPPIGKGSWLVKSGQAAFLTPDSAQSLVQLVNRSPVVVTWKVTNLDCTDEADVIIYPFDITEDDFPNVITPNNDGKNDTWRIISGKPTTASVRILNRWGGYVFESPSYTNNWSGEGLNEGVYYYRVLVSGCRDEFKGTVQIMR